MSPVLVFLLAAAVYGPQLWVRWVMWLHNDDIDSLRGTGGELATHLVKRLALEGVTVVESSRPDHYNPEDKTVNLSAANFHGKSLTAVAVAAHEVGHAIQHNRQDVGWDRYQRYVPIARTLQRVGVMFLSLPGIAVALQQPKLALLAAIPLVATMGSAAVVHLLVLPLEWDASFGKALPILKQGEYLDEEKAAAASSVLRAAAFTYVASALADILSCWRWGGILRR